MAEAKELKSILLHNDHTSNRRASIPSRKRSSMGDRRGSTPSLRTLSRESIHRKSSVKGMPEVSGGDALLLPGELEDHLIESGGFVFNEKGFSSAEASEKLTLFGKNELPDKSMSKWKQFLLLLVQPMALMMWLAAGVEAGIKNWIDMSILLAIIFANAGISFYESNKAGDAIAALKASLRPVATVKRDGKWQSIDGSLIVPGDLVLLAAGSAIPADCRINKGTIEVDQSGLTGESIPVKMTDGDPVHHPKMGSTVTKGEVEATVEHTGASTVMGQTASLLTGTNRSNLDMVLMRVTLVLVFISLVLSAIVFTYGLVDGQELAEDLGFTVVLIVASIPLAIEIVCTTTLALGSRQLSKDGAIVSRLSSIEDLAGMSMLCSDKTGTLTTNKMEIQDECHMFTKGEDRASCLQLAAMAAKWREPPRDALDTLVLGAADLVALKDVEQLDYLPFDPNTKRTESTVKLPGGATFQVSKGAPHVMIALCIASEAEKHQMHAVQQNLAGRGIRALAVAKTNAQNEWKMVGMLTFLDPPRPDSRQTIIEAKEFGVPVKMITGDHLLIAQETARVLGIPGDIEGPEDLPMLTESGDIPTDLVENFGVRIEAAGGFAQVYPQHKYLIVACLRAMRYKVGMTGDGVNDAPALKQADVGIAVSGATDAARAAADIVLTEPGLHTIINGIILAREIFQRIQNFISYRIAASLQLLLFFFVAVLSMSPETFQPDSFVDPNDDVWPKFFRMPVLLLMLITLLNDGTLITIGYDNVAASPKPCQWHYGELFFTSSVLGLVSCGSSLALLYVALDSWKEDSVLRVIGLRPVPYSIVSSMMYLKISVSDFLTLFSSRTGSDFFFTTRPAWVLLGAAFFSLSLSTLIALFIPTTILDGVPIQGLYEHESLLALAVWGYCIVVWIIQDLCKVVAYRMVRGLGKNKSNNKYATLDM